MNDTKGILIAYDGSDDARHAIAVAARELGPRPAEVVHVWEPLATATTYLPIYASISPDEVEFEAQRATETGDEGARVAREAGFDATPVTLRSDGPVAGAIVRYVNEHKPSLVVMGTRGLSGVRSAIVGSVSHAVTQHLDVPVLIVPPEHD